MNFLLGGGCAANFRKVTADGVMEMMVRYDRADKGGGGEQARKVVSSAACQHASICELQGWRRQTRFKTLLPLSQPPRCFGTEKKNHTLCGRSRDSLKWNSENRFALWVCALSLFYYVFITITILCYVPSLLKREQQSQWMLDQTKVLRAREMMSSNVFQDVPFMSPVGSLWIVESSWK